VAISKAGLGGTAFSWTPDIVYIGMTCAKGGLKGRLRQFDDTMAGKRTCHGGADRVRYKHEVYSTFARKAYVAVWSVKCSPADVTPKCLRALGRVAALEFICWADFHERCGALPEFNDKARSPKYSTQTSARAVR